MKTTHPRLVAVCLLALGSAAQAAMSNDLAGDFSNASNPNGAWSFTQGTAPLAHFASSSAHPFNPAVSDGLWGIGGNMGTDTPFVIRTTADGSAVGETDAAWLNGDVIVHSTNPGGGAPLFINWTAPGAGTVDFDVAVWYAHYSVNRRSDVVVTLNGSVLDTGAVGWDLPSTRSAPLTFAAAALPVAAGDVLGVSFMASAGETWGSVAGIAQMVVFAPIPEPSTLALWAGGLGLLLVAARRRAQNVDPA